MEKPIKMIITDLDQTLLNNEKKITKYTESILQNCRNKGIIIAFATARPLRAVKIFFNSIEPNALIYHSGTVVLVDNKQVFQCGIERGIVKNILEKIINDNPEANLSIESNDEIYVNFNLSKYWNDTDLEYENLNMENLPQNNIEKIIIGLDTVCNIDEIKYDLPKELYLETSEGKIGIIMNKNATKWNGIKILMEHYQIDAGNIIAFGDDYMDLEMIRNCGIGVAMENGIIEVKNAAKYICGKNDEDGVAKWIEDNILKNGLS
ncbi:MAG: HAD family hydrolase [Treponema sp.]|nr:HAD family hydrolase [Treponema sp.]